MVACEDCHLSAWPVLIYVNIAPSPIDVCHLLQWRLLPPTFWRFESIPDGKAPSRYRRHNGSQRETRSHAAVLTSGCLCNFGHIAQMTNTEASVRMECPILVVVSTDRRNTLS